MNDRFPIPTGLPRRAKPSASPRRARSDSKGGAGGSSGLRSETVFLARGPPPLRLVTTPVAVPLWPIVTDARFRPVAPRYREGTMLQSQ